MKAASCCILASSVYLTMPITTTLSLVEYVNFINIAFKVQIITLYILLFSARHTNKLKAGTSPWPPFRLPSPCGEAYEDPRKILRSRVFHAVAFVVLYKAVRGLVSEHVMALLVFLLEQAVLVCEKDDEVSGISF